MSQFEERTSISQFDVKPNGCIGIRKTTEIVKDGEVVSRTHWRCVLAPNDSMAAEVLNEPHYASLAQQVWTPEVVSAYQAQQAAARP